MTYAALPPTVRVIGDDVLTAKQREAFDLELAGWGLQRIARRLGIAKQSVDARLDGAHRKLRHAGVRQDEFGRWFVEEEVAA